MLFNKELLLVFYPPIKSFSILCCDTLVLLGKLSGVCNLFITFMVAAVTLKCSFYIDLLIGVSLASGVL